MKLIFLHGTAASGKLTTARALEVLLGYPVFHNHLVVDTLTSTRVGRSVSRTMCNFSCTGPSGHRPAAESDELDVAVSG